MSALPDLTTAPTLWPAQVADAVVASGELRATISILDPATAAYTPYDPFTDAGGPGTMTAVISGREARVIPSGEPGTDSATEDGYQSVQRSHLVQFVDEAGDPEVLPGFVVRITAIAEGGDPFMVNKQLIVEESAAARRTRSAPFDAGRLADGREGPHRHDLGEGSDHPAHRLDHG